MLVNRLAVVAATILLLFANARPGAADDLSLALGATYDPIYQTSDLIGATSQLECFAQTGVCLYHVIGTPKDWAGRPGAAIAGTLANGQRIVATTLVSPGNGRGHVFLVLLWTVTHGHWKFVGYIPSVDGNDFTMVGMAAGDLLLMSTVYGPNDPDCCSTALKIERYTLDGLALHKISSTTMPVKAYHGVSIPQKL